jgi:hypothetical protein
MDLEQIKAALGRSWDRRPPMRRPLVKLLVPTAGLFALYLGGLLGIMLSERGAEPVSWLKQLAFAAFFGLLAVFGAVFGADAAIGREADHVDVLKTVFYMGAAAVAVTLERLAGERIGWALPQFLENLAIWGAGVASIWEAEPSFPGWKAALKPSRPSR